MVRKLSRKFTYFYKYKRKAQVSAKLNSIKKVNV